MDRVGDGKGVSSAIITSASNDFSFELQKCAEHSREARRAGMHIHDLFSNNNDEEARQFVSGIRQEAWQSGTSAALDAILAEVPSNSLRQLFDGAPPLMYSKYGEELIGRSLGRQEYDAKARKLSLGTARPWCSMYDAKFAGIPEPAPDAPLSVSLFLDPPSRSQELLDALVVMKDKPYYYKVAQQFVREHEMFLSEATAETYLSSYHEKDRNVSVVKQTAEIQGLTEIKPYQMGAVQHQIAADLGVDDYQVEITDIKPSSREDCLEIQYEVSLLDNVPDREMAEYEHLPLLMNEEKAYEKTIRRKLEKMRREDTIGFTDMYPMNRIGQADRASNAWYAEEIDEAVKHEVAQWQLMQEEKMHWIEGQAICDNKLFFKVALDAFCGYNVESKFNFAAGGDFHGRAAVMGGAVLAALTAQRAGPEIAAMFAPLEEYWSAQSAFTITQQIQLLSEYRIKKYSELRTKVVDRLHEYFVGLNFGFQRDEKTFKTYSRPYCWWNTRYRYQSQHTQPIKPSSLPVSSEFEGGDIDLFVESSCRLKIFAEQGVANLQADLDDDLPWPIKKPRAMKNWDTKVWPDYVPDNGFTFCKTASVLSMYYAPGKKNKMYRWPRTTQMIELDKRASLLDALLDFDIDAAACMWDGANVVALPRAIQALSTNTLLCRPGILQHSRNRARLSKYGRRGFASRLLE